MSAASLLVKLFNNEQREFNRYEKSNARMVQINIRESLAGRWFRAALSIFASTGPMLIYLVGGLLMIRYGSALTIGDIIVMVALLDRMYRPVNALMSIQVDIVRSMALFTRIFEYLDLPTEIKNAEQPLVPDRISGDLAFEHVQFDYDPKKALLRDISFEVKSGHSLAIVGPSGAGKSSIINLIPRLYDVTGGKITLDGTDIREIDLAVLRQSIGMVTQDTYLFNGTIRENLMYANPEATDDDLIEACRKANLHDFILAQPDGYDTVVGNRGLKLSGGEKQRVSIARVILKDPPILIFDEATSSLDSISENLIQEAIDPLIRGRTSIIIAHRLSTIMAADSIMVVRDGRVVEAGRHRDLVNNGGLYNQLYETQFKLALENQA